MRLVELAHAKIKEVLRCGDLCIDATSGNGYDTLFLAREVAPLGKVYAFDIQKSALLLTTKRLEKNGLSNFCEFIHASHADMSKLLDKNIKEKITATMFNLGYLPGGDHRIITTSVTTINAIMEAYEMLKAGGIITILGYRGHQGGMEETNDIIKLCQNKRWQTEKIEGTRSLDSPVLILIRKN